MSTSPRFTDLAGRLAVVTGGGRGIGLVTTQRLVEQGVRVVVLDRAMSSADVGCAFLELDVTDVDAVEAAVATVVEPVGGAGRRRELRGDLPQRGRRGDVDAGLDERDRRQPVRAVLRHPGVRPADARARLGLGDQHRVDERDHQQLPAEPGRVQRLEGRRDPPVPLDRGGVGGPRGPGQLGVPGLHRDGDDAVGDRGSGRTGRRPGWSGCRSDGWASPTRWRT